MMPTQRHFAARVRSTCKKKTEVSARQREVREKLMGKKAKRKRQKKRKGKTGRERERERELERTVNILVGSILASKRTLALGKV